MLTGFRKSIEFYREERYKELLYGTIYFVPGASCEHLNAYVKRNAQRITKSINQDSDNWVTCNIVYLDADNTFFAPQEKAAFYSAMMPTNDTIEQGHSFLAAVLENCETEHMEKAFARFFRTLQVMFDEVLDKGKYRNIHFIFPEVLSFDADEGLVCIKLADGAKGIAGLPPKGHQRTPRQELSRLTNRNCKLILVDYNNKELKLNPQGKALYVFFLRHSEGVRKTELINHKDEFLDIFRQCSTRDDPQWQRESVEKLLRDGGVDLKSSLRAKLSSCNDKVRKIIADDAISWNYEIEERRGHRYGIYLKRQLVELKKPFEKSLLK